MTTLDDLARVAAVMHSVGGGGASCFNCQRWADTIAAYVKAQRERDAVAVKVPRKARMSRQHSLDYAIGWDACRAEVLRLNAAKTDKDKPL